MGGGGGHTGISVHPHISKQNNGESTMGRALLSAVKYGRNSFLLT